MDYFNQVQTLEPNQQALFYNQFNQSQKNFAVAFLLCFFLGGFGIHKFYLDQASKGVLYLVFCWTFIPSLLALINLFTMSSEVKKMNNALANKIIANLKLA